MVIPLLLALILFLLATVIISLVFIMKTLSATRNAPIDLPHIDPTLGEKIYGNKMLLSNIEQKLNKVPDLVLNKATGKANVVKGNLGELASYLKLKSTYSRILPISDVVDFLCIKFPENGEPGRIDFIDIKTGSGRLTKEQKTVKDIIEEKNIYFQKITIKVDDITK